MNHTSSGSSGNHSSPGSSDSVVRSGPLPLSKALVGFTNAKLAEGLSQRTVDSYLEDLQKWVERTGDWEIDRTPGLLTSPCSFATKCTLGRFIESANLGVERLSVIQL